MCPDEEGTETRPLVIQDVAFVNVEACAPMKRGLKLPRTAGRISIRIVEACAPMKRGLKQWARDRGAVKAHWLKHVPR